ncbi:11464_t:CDS:2, partial [Gigaspora rosea]
DRLWITIMLACNTAETEKLKPLVIGSSISPRALLHMNYNSLPVIYRANSRAWMRNDIFSEWLKDLDQRFRIQNCQVLLLVDNASSHFHDQTNVPESHESNSDLDEEISDDNLEPEVTPVLHGNRQGRGRPSKHVTGGSQGHYGSGYGQPHPIPDYSNIK